MFCRISYNGTLSQSTNSGILRQLVQGGTSKWVELASTSKKKKCDVGNKVLAVT